jgi:hypothetical protein
MGCGNSRDFSLSEIVTDLERVESARYDKFYEEAEKMLKDIHDDASQLDEILTKFVYSTGAHKVNVSLGIALSALLVAVAVENNCDFMASGLQISKKSPGILLPVHRLSENTKPIYESWVQLLDTLNQSIGNL